MYQFQDPQEDNIRDAKDLILVPDSMVYYREHKEQEQEKAKREETIAEFQARAMREEGDQMGVTYVGREEREESCIPSEVCMVLFGLLVRDSHGVCSND